MNSIVIKLTDSEYPVGRIKHWLAHNGNRRPRIIVYTVARRAMVNNKTCYRTQLYKANKTTEGQGDVCVYD